MAARHAVLGLGVVVTLATVVAAGCSGSAAGPDAIIAGPAATSAATVGDVGRLPGSFGVGSRDPAADTSDTESGDTESGDTESGDSGDSANSVDSADSVDSAVDSTTGDSVTTTSVPPTTIPVAETIGAKVTGNRLLIIGDSLTASISERYGGEACDALVPLGWEVEVDAETGRFIDFGARVLDTRLDAGWDAAVLFLGNNYGYDRGVYQLILHSLLMRLAPRPTVLITTSLFRPQQAEVNAAILEEATLFDNVTVIDWQTLSQEPSLTGRDNLHFTPAGRARLGYQLAFAMGPAPKQPGECLSTKYRNDSAGSPNGPTGNTAKNTTKNTTKTSGATATTAKPTPTTAATSPNQAATTTTPPTSPIPTTAPTAPTATTAVATPQTNTTQAATPQITALPTVTTAVATTPTTTLAANSP